MRLHAADAKVRATLMPIVAARVTWCYSSPAAVTMLRSRDLWSDLALKSGGFELYKAGVVNITSSLSKGYKVVYVTDRTTYRARILSYDTVLVAKPGALKGIE